MLTLAAALVLLAWVPTAAAGPGASEPRPQGLWRSYPLDPSGGDKPARTAPAHRRSRASTDDAGQTSRNTAFLMAFGLGGAALVAGLGVFATRWRGAPAGISRREHGLRSGRRSHQTEGGFTMSNARRRIWARDESPDPEVPEEPGTQGTYVSPRERIVDYTGGEDPDRELSDAAPEHADEPRDSDLASVGAEVETVLASARDAAARIRAAAETEAERLRSDAEEYADETRSAAKSDAEETRAQADRQAAEIVDEAQVRLAEADAEAERKLSEIEGTARDRAEELQLATERHEERLESMLAVFRGVCSQLEGLLDARRDTEEDVAPDEDIDHRLRLNIVRSSDERF